MNEFNKDNWNKENSIRTNIAALIIFLSVFIIFLWRVQRGFGWSDEPYYTAIAYRIIEGDPAFLTSWNIQQFSAFIYAPILKTFIVVSNGTTGCILFMRIIYILLKFASVAFFYFSIKQYTSKYAAVAASLLLLCTDAIYTLSYNTMMVIFITFAVSIILNKDFLKNHLQIKWVLCGIATGLAVQSYPTLIIAIPILILWIIYDVKSEGAGRIINSLLFCVVGGIVVIAIFLIELYLNHSSLVLLKDNLHYLFEDPDHVNDTFHLSQYIRDIIELKWLIPTVASIVALEVINAVKKDGADSLKMAFVMFSLSIELVFVMMLVFPLENKPFNYYSFVYIASVAPVAFAANKHKGNAVIWIYMLGIALSIAVDIASNNTVELYAYPYVLCVIATIVYLENYCKGFFRLYARIITAVIVLLFLIARVDYVYRDEGLLSLDARMNTGPAAGIYTTEERLLQYNNTIDAIDKYMPKEGNVLYVKLLPFGYLCSSSKPATPNLFRVNLDDIIFEEYYENNPQKYPDAIYIVNEGYGVINEDVHYQGYLYSYINEKAKKIIELDCATIILFK